MQGEVIGINAAKIADDEVEGMGFAIPRFCCNSGSGTVDGIKYSTEKLRELPDSLRTHIFAPIWR